MNQIRAEQRAIIYKLLSDCYQSPNEDFYGHIKKLNESISQLYPDVVKKATPSFSSPAESIKELKVEHSRLFLGPFKILAPPYGSVYLDHDEHLMTDSTRDVQSRYEEEGMTVAIQEVPDHLCIELEFIYLLAYKEKKMIELVYSDRHRNGVQNYKLNDLDGYSMDPTVLELMEECRIKQIDFLKSHLAQWFPQFEKRVREHAVLKIYSDLVTLTSNFLITDLNAVMNERYI